MENQHHVFEYGGQQFVSGLFWQTVTSAGDWRSEARAQVKFQFKDMDLITFCQLKDPFGIPQVGFGSTVAGAKVGAASIAAAIARAVGQRFNHSNWMGVFPLEGDFYVLVAVIKDALLPEGDCAGTKTEVLERFGQEYGQTNQWEAIFAPKALQISNSQELNLEDLIPFKGGKFKLKSPSRLEPVEGSNTKLFMAAGAAVLALGLAYVGFVKWQEINQVVLEVPVPQALQDVGLKKELPPIILPLPWKTEPEAAQVALMCMDSVQKAPFGPGGWIPEKLICEMNGVTLSWNRGASNLAFIKAAIPSVNLGDINKTPGDHASLFIPKKLPAPYEDETMAVVEDARLALIGLVQGFGIQGSVNEIEDVYRKTDEKGQVTIKSWKNFKYKLTGQLPPWDFVTLASHIHGLRLKKATLTGDQWELEGEIYGK